MKYFKESRLVQGVRIQLTQSNGVDDIMAKYTRHDIRNKKKDKEKSLKKDIKLLKPQQSKREKYGMKYEENELYT